MKKILIPTDFSDNAGDALDYALNLTKDQPVEYHIIHVITPIVVANDVAVTTVPISKIQMDLALETMDGLEAFGKAFFKESNMTNVQLSTSVEVGGVATCIKQKAKNIGADLIIMGTQGSNHSLLEKAIGTISTDVLENAPCPIILVPKAYKFKLIDNVIFSTNLNHSDPYELWKATEALAPQIGIIRCLYVTPSKKKENAEEIEEFTKYLEEHSPSIKTVLDIEESKSIESTIAKCADDYDAELIIMHRSKKSLWKSIFTTSHTKKMVFWANVPLMILN